MEILFEISLRSLGKSSRGEKLKKTDLKEIGCKAGQISVRSRADILAESYQHGNTFSISIKTRYTSSG
jgi:hypothetical protein